MQFFAYAHPGCISIHALLAESDACTTIITICIVQFLSTLSLRRATYLVRGQRPSWGISIHALLAESDIRHTVNLHPEAGFLSTLSLRRATIHAPNQRSYHCNISIHALLAESDRADYNKSMLLHLFLSTLSLRRATRALRQLQPALCNFYPRSPCGERLFLCCDYVFRLFISIHALLAESDYSFVVITFSGFSFLSTLSLRRATIPLL